MNTRQSLRLIAAAAAAANGGKTLHINGNGAFENEKGSIYCGNYLSKNCELDTVSLVVQQIALFMYDVTSSMHNLFIIAFLNETVKFSVIK